MSEHRFSVPFHSSHRLPELRVNLAPRQAPHQASEVREACLVGSFALAIFWVAAELAIAFGLR